MAGEVGQLTVNLGLNAAGFSGGITEAGKAARKCGQEIQQGMDEGKYSMMEARHATMMLAESFGVHIPRGISTMIASIGPVGAIMAAAFPFAAIALGAVLVFKEISKVREEAKKLAEALSEAFIKGEESQGALKDKINETAIKTDELTGNIKDKLARELAAVDKATLKDLSGQFEGLDKSVGAALEHMKGHWYTLSTGSAGAATELQRVKEGYEGLIAVAQNSGNADDALKAQQYLEAALKHNRDVYDEMTERKAEGLYVDEKDYEAQKLITNAIFQQVNANKQLIDQNASGQKGNLELKTQKDLILAYAATQRTQMEGDEQHLAAIHAIEKAQSEAANAATEKSGTPMEKEQVSFGNADKELLYAKQIADQKLKIAENAREVGLTEAGEDEQKREEVEAKYANAVRAHQDALTAAVFQFNKARADAVAKANAEEVELDRKLLEQKLKTIEKIDSEAKKEAQAELASAKEAADGAKEIDAATTEQRIAQIKIQESQFKITKAQALQEEMDEDKRALAAKIASINEATAAELAALQKQHDANATAASAQAAAGINAGDSRYHDYLQENADLEIRMGSLGAKAQSDIQAATIKTATALEKLNADIKASGSDWSGWAAKTFQDVSSVGQVIQTVSHQMQSSFNTALTGFGNAIAKTVVEGKSLGSAMKNVAKEILESWISMTVQMVAKWLISKISMGAIDKLYAAQGAAVQIATDKAKVVSAAGVAGAEGVASFAGAPWPIDMGAPAFGADMAGTAMAFGSMEQGGLVGYDDMIIAAHKNEMVLPANLSQKVQNMTDDKKGGTTVHVHYSPTVHAIDGKGIGQVLNEHSSVIQAHVQKALRRTNKG